MSFDWADLAGDLIDNHDQARSPEAVLRASIGRSYYAAFCTARDELEEQGLNVPRSGAHGVVGRHYGASSDAIGREIGANLGRLLKQRLIADYDRSPRKAISPNLAKLCYLLCIETLRLLDDRDGS
jgi:hypothetical protein